MAGIRVSTGAKRIEGNDEGDYIVLNFNDHSFPERFFAMLDRVQALAEEAAPQEQAIRQQYEAGSMELLRALTSLDGEIHRKISTEVDGKHRAEFVRMKKRFSLGQTYTEEEQAAISGFMEQLKQSET